MRHAILYRRYRLLPILALSIASVVASALAQNYPSKPIRIIVPFAAGGAADNVARMIAEPLAQRLKQSVVIENRPGASGIPGTQAAARAAPDGYTLIVGTQSTHGLNIFFVRDIGYDPIKDFAPVTMLTTYANVLVVAANSPYQSLQQLIDKARSAAGELSFGTSGLGSSQYLAGQKFQSAAKVKLLHIPYKGGAGAITDVIGGQITMVFETISVARPMIQDGRLRALAVTAPTAVSALPVVKPIAEIGLPGFEMQSYLAVFAPAGTPPEIIERLNQELIKVVKLPDVQTKMRLAGMEPAGQGPQELAARLRVDMNAWAALVAESGDE